MDIWGTRVIWFALGMLFCKAMWMVDNRLSEWIGHLKDEGADD